MFKIKIIAYYVDSVEVDDEETEVLCKSLFVVVIV